MKTLDKRFLFGALMRPLHSFTLSLDQAQLKTLWVPAWILLLIPRDCTIHLSISYFFQQRMWLSSRAELLTVENVIFGDKYLFYKNAYLQRREFLELDGEVIDAFDDEF